MAINRDKFDAELVTAGVPAPLGYCQDGPQQGRAAWADGLIVQAGWDGAAALEQLAPDDPARSALLARAVAYRNALLAHDPTETAGQKARRRLALAPIALAVCAKVGYAAAPAWVQAVVDALAARVGEGA